MLQRTVALVLFASAAACGDSPVGVEIEPPPPAGSLLAQLRTLPLDSLSAPVQTYFSPGARQRAEALQLWLRAADAFFRDRLGVAPPFRLAVLDQEHWARVAFNPYGVPFVSDSPRVVVLPAVREAAAVTQIYRAAQQSLPAHAAADLARLGITYDEAVLEVLDLIGFHEVGHVFIAALGFHPNNTARWLEELLATYAAYSYLHVHRPGSIAVWDALSEALLEFVEPSTRSLDDFNQLYIQGLGPVTYGWFQSHFNLRATAVVAHHPQAGWLHTLSAAGLAGDTRGLATAMLLSRLDATMPHFTRWAENSGLVYR